MLTSVGLNSSDFFVLLQNHASNQREVIEEIEDEKRQLDMMSARLEGEMSALKDTLEEEKRESQTLRQRVKTLSQEVSSDL